MAVLKQERHVELVPGGAEAFVITNEMFSASIPAQLPHLNVFVISVPDAADPKKDALARVANLADLSLIPIGRTAGIAAPGSNGIEYLSTVTTVRYDTLETANTAATAFVDRVNALIQGWITYSTSFVAPDPSPASYTLPRVDPTQVTALINAYTLAKQTRYQKQLAKTSADTALTNATLDYNYKTNLASALDPVVAATTTVSNEMTSAIQNFRSLLDAGNTFYSANTGGTGAAAFNAALVTATTQSSAMTTYESDAGGADTAARNYRSNRSSEAATAGTTLTAAQAAATAAAQQLVSAQALENAALAAVIAVCPNFDKHSIPFVPDTEP